jgi:hypothetical protein
LVAEGAATRGNVFAGETSSANQNTGHGIVFRAAAALNTASAVSLNGNRAGSVLFTGAGTTGNQVLDSFLTGGLFPADVALSGTGVTFSEGATANEVVRTSVAMAWLSWAPPPLPTASPTRPSGTILVLA